MREIKFRFWHKKLKEYVEMVYQYCPVLSRGRIESEEHIIEQYTGLKDKQGKEIYEGDILKVKLNAINILIDVVYFNNMGSWIINNYKLFTVIHESIIIGNIHTNPELLK